MTRQDALVTQPSMETCLYERIMGSDWQLLDPAIQHFHESDSIEGTFSIQRGTGFLARAVMWFWRLPPNGESVPTHLLLRRSDGGEEWLRRFGTRELRSVQWEAGGVLMERFGAVQLRMRLTVEGSALAYELHGIDLKLGNLRLSLFPWLRPRIQARERADGETIHVTVRAEAPITGLLVAYDGTLQLGAAPVRRLRRQP